MQEDGKKGKEERPHPTWFWCLVGKRKKKKKKAKP
jgi:hypothetical protein